MRDGVTLKKVVVVFKSHFDLGFTDTAKHVFRQMENMFRKAAEVCEQTAHWPEGKRYVWTVPSWPLWHCLNDASVSRELKNRLEELVRQGRIVYHALPGTLSSELCGAEDLCRGLSIARELSEHYGHLPVSAKMTDVPGCAWLMPEVLGANGVRFLHLGCNAGCKSPHVPDLFRWQGSGGTLLSTFYSHHGYGTDTLPPDDWDYPVWLALIHAMDNHGPPSTEEVARVLHTIEEACPEAQVTIGSLDDFYLALQPYEEQLPIVTGALTDTWNHGAGSYPQEVSALRRTRESLLDLECSAAVGFSRGQIDRTTAARLTQCARRAYCDQFLFCEHTFGLDVKTFLHDRVYEKKAFLQQKQQPESRLLEASWEEQREYIRSLRSELEQMVSLLPGSLGKTAGAALRRTDKASAQMDESHFETPYYQVCVDRKACKITSVFDKTLRHEWVSPAEGTLFRYQYNTYPDHAITEYLRSYAKKFYFWLIDDLGRIGYNEKHACVSCPQEGLCGIFSYGDGVEVLFRWDLSQDESCRLYGNGRELECRCRFWNASPEIHVNFCLTDKQETPVVEAGHAVFCLNLDVKTPRINETGCMIHPMRDVVPGSNNTMFLAEGFIDLCGETAAMKIEPVDSPLVSFGRERIYTYAPEASAVHPPVYFNLFNNQWGTNFPQWLGGTIESEFRLYPHAAALPGHELFSLGTRPGRTDLPFELCTPGLVLQNFKIAEDCSGVILRLRFHGEEKQQGMVRFSLKMSRVYLCTPDERPVEQPTIQNDSISFSVCPGGLYTLSVGL